MLIVARLFGIIAVKVGQPRVMGEVIAGIALGPSLLGAISPNLQATFFPSDILPALGVVANLGLIFYIFLIGLEVDRGQLKGKAAQAAAISNASVALPMLLGIAVALPLYKLVGPQKKFVAFALFMGVAMSITAFPVLARILVERRMLKRPVGALTIACAAIDDVTAWFLIALATTIAVAGTFGDVIKTIAEAIAFCSSWCSSCRRIVARMAIAFDEVGRIPGRLVRGDHRRRAAVRLRHRGDQHRVHLRRVHHGHDHAAPRAAERGDHAADRRLRRDAAAAGVLRLHRPEDERRPARPARAVAAHARC